MAFELPDGKTGRTLAEQVTFLTEKLKELYAAVNRIGIRIVVVEELPDEGAPATIYLVPVEDPEEGNYYEEYLWIDEAWELIGTTQIDLSNYAKLNTSNNFTAVNSFKYRIDFVPADDTDPPASISYSYSNSAPLFTFEYEGGELVFLSDSALYPYQRTDLGTSTYKFNDLYLGGKAQFSNSNAGGSATYQIKENDYGQLALSRTYNNSETTYFLIDGGTLLPNNNNLSDLGTQNKLFRNLFLSGELKDGTNSATVADIAALITYAKGQGWIS